jgi:hypothetical protein
MLVVVVVVMVVMVSLHCCCHLWLLVMHHDRQALIRDWEQVGARLRVLVLAAVG